MVFACLKFGFRKMWLNKPMVFIFYLANLFFGLLLMFPFRSSVSSFIGDSLMGRKLGGSIDMDFLFELLKYNQGSIPSIMSVAAVALFAYWLVNLFLSGGVLAIFAGEDKYTAPDFWSSAANYFGRFFRLALGSIIVLAALMLMPLAVNGIERLFFGNDPYEWISYWGRWLRVTLGFLGILVFFMIFDYARIYTVLTNEKKIRTALLEGIRFVLGNFRRSFTLIVALFLIGTIALLGYNQAADMLSSPNAMVVLFLLALQQLFIFFRMMLRLALYAGEMNLFMNLSDRVAPPFTPTFEEEVVIGRANPVGSDIEEDKE